MVSTRAARSSSIGGRSAFRVPSWAGFMTPLSRKDRARPTGVCKTYPRGAEEARLTSMECPHEAAAGQQRLRLGARRHRRGDGGGDLAVDLVVLQLAPARDERDLEDEELSLQAGRVDVVRQPRAVAHREAVQRR